MTEFEIIDLIRRKQGGGDRSGRVAGDGAAGDGEHGRAATLLAADDCAVLAPTKAPLVTSVDTLLAGTHFPADAPPFLIGKRAMAVCASDLAAMGADPLGCLLALGLPEQHNNFEYVDGLADGIAAAARDLRLPLLGGNLVKSNDLQLGITVFGETPKPLTRAGAQAGDIICVSGCLGDGAGGLKFAGGDGGSDTGGGGAGDTGSGDAGDSKDRQYLRDAYYYPYASSPAPAAPSSRLELGRRLRDYANCCIDISDGLVADLMHLLEQAKPSQGKRVQAELRLSQLPYSPALKKEFDAKTCEEFALYGGDDYELLFTLSDAGALEELRKVCPVTEIGAVEFVASGEKTPRIIAINSDGKTQDLPIKGYRHF